jgi:co-chaperonin GroES (HSP10)
MTKQEVKKMTEQVIPIGKKLLIKQKKAETFYKNTNIIIPEAAQKVENKGTVVAVGEGITEIKIGDMIQYSEHCLPTSMMHDDEEHLLIHEGDVYAKFKYV